MSERPNIVLVTVDSLRADHCGCYGYEKDTTPTLDWMAEDGVKFEHAIAPGPSTPVSMPRIFTGKSVAKRDVTDLASEEIEDFIEEHRTIPERLSARQYTTIGFTPNPFTSRHFGYGRCFDHFEDFLSKDGSLGIRQQVTSHWIDGKFVGGLRFGLNMTGFGDISMSWEEYYDEILQVVDDVEEPFFLWVFLLEPHWPYRPPSRHNEISTFKKYLLNWKASNLADTTPNPADIRGLRQLYDGAIRHADEFVERIQKDLAECDPVTIFHADHGEAFGEHGHFGHGQYLHRENIHVPLVVGNMPDSKTIEEPINLNRMPDLIDSIADSTNPDLSGHTSEYVVSRAHKKRSVRGSDWKYIRSGESTEWYDLAPDDEETTPQSASEEVETVLDPVQKQPRMRDAEKEYIADSIKAVIDHV